jgi:hypothetical protein
MRLHLLLHWRLVSFGKCAVPLAIARWSSTSTADPPPAIDVYSAGNNPLLGDLYRIRGGSPILFLWYMVDVGHREPSYRTPVECAAADLRAVEPELRVWGGAWTPLDPWPTFEIRSCDNDSRRGS